MPLNDKNDPIIHFLEMVYLENDITQNNIIKFFMPYYLAIEEDEKFIYNNLGLSLMLYANNGTHIATLESLRDFKQYRFDFVFAFYGNETGIEIKTYKKQGDNYFDWEETWYNVSEFF